MRAGGLRGHDAPRRLGDRHLVRLRLDALGPVPLPVRERGDLQGALPGRFHLRGDRPDPRLVLHAARGVGAALRHLELPERGLPRPDPRPRGPEDVEEPRQRRGSVGRHRQPRRGCVPLVLLRLQGALGGLPLLAGHRRGCGPPLPADALEHVLVLGALRERRGLRTGRPVGGLELRETRGGLGGRTRSLGALAAAPHDRRGPRAHGELRLHARRACDRRLQRRALQLVRAPQPPALLGRGRGGVRHPAALPTHPGHAARAVHAVPRRRDLHEPRGGNRRGIRGRPGLGPPLRLPGGR